MPSQQSDERLQAATRAVWAHWTSLDRWELSVTDARDMARRALAAADEAVASTGKDQHGD